MKIQTSYRRVWLTLVLTGLFATVAAAQQRSLTIDDIYDPATRVNFSGGASGDLSWIDGTHYAQPKTVGGSLTWMTVDAATGTERPLFDAAKMEAALGRLPGVQTSEARRLSRSRNLDFDNKYSAVLVTIDSDLYLYRFDNDQAVRLTSTAGEKKPPPINPHHQTLAFLREKYPSSDRLIVGVGWPPDSRSLTFEVQNRIQTWIELNTVGAAGGTPHTLLRDTSKAFIDPGDYQTPTWLKDGTFLWLSDTSGWKHVFHYAADGALIKQVTSGKWELRTLHGVDEAAGWIYFSGTERSAIGGDVYRVKVDGSGFERLSKAAGTHGARFSPTFAYYIGSWSDVTTPTQVRLYRNSGAEVRVIDENKETALAQFKLSKPEFLQVPTRDGFVMEAMIIKPRDIDPARG